MNRGVIIALSVLAAIVLITLIIVIVVALTVSSHESRPEDGENS